MPLKVLIVEDDPASLDLMTEVLASAQIQTKPVDNGETAAALVNREKFDGIFLDLQIPGLHGFDLTRRIRQSAWNKSTPVVVVTGWDENTAMEQVFDVGATLFLRKPIDRQKLLRLMRVARGLMVDNRRRFARVPLTTEAQCEGPHGSVLAVTSNISQGGILRQSAPFAVGDQVKLTFTLPENGVVINATGLVVWRDKRRRVGIRFTDVNQAGRMGIRQLIDGLAVA